MIDQNPYSPPTALSDRPISMEMGPNRKSLRRLVVVKFIIVVCALVAEHFSVESIVATGPLLALAGVLIASVGFRTRIRAALWYGVSAVFFALSVLALINVNRWSPVEARLPVAILSIGYGVFATWATWWFVYRNPDVADVQ